MIFDPSKYQDIAEWNLDRLTVLPSEEIDRIEYKSSRVKVSKLGAKISVAASAFWNSGGGLLVLGVDPETGLPDGGLPPADFGRQSIRDWIDQAIARTEPPGPYAIQTLVGDTETEGVDVGNVVALVGFGASENPPHMASDDKYYIRLGAHSVPIRHYLVEALRSRRLPDLSASVSWKLKKLTPGGRGGAEIRLEVMLFLKNEGGAIARFPCLTIRQPIGWKPQKDNSRVGSPSLPPCTPPVGWWKRGAGRADHVLYPGDEVYVGQVFCDMNPECPDFRLEYEVVSDGTQPKPGEIVISGEDIRKAMESL